MSPNAMTILLRTTGSRLDSRIRNSKTKCCSQNCAETHINLVSASVAACRRIGDYS